MDSSDDMSATKPRVDLHALAELFVKWSGVIALLGGALWGLYRWNLSGGSDWMVNVEVTAEVLPYADAASDVRLLVAHVKTKNPTSTQVTFKRDDSTFTLAVHQVPANLKPGAAVQYPEGAGLGPAIDLLADAGDYVFMPGAEFEDTRAFVIKADTSVVLIARLSRKSTWRGPEDFVSAERYVFVK